MDVRVYMADQIVRIGVSLSGFLESTDPERLHWKPGLNGSAPTRSVLELVGECVAVNKRFASLLRGEAAERAEEEGLLVDSWGRQVALRSLGHLVLLREPIYTMAPRAHLS